MKSVSGRGILASIEALPEQIREGWRAAHAARFPSAFSKATNVVVSGMGGSALGAHLIKSLYGDELSVPFETVSDYRLPGHVGKNSLIILSSYSGTTEETIATAKEALKRKAMCLALTTGGDLEALAIKHRWPVLKIGAETNPSNQPRMAIGSSAFTLIGSLAKLGFLDLKEGEVDRLATFLRQTTSQPAAQELAVRMRQRFTLFLAAEHLYGAAHVMNNQVNENAKHLSTFMPLPELNHHFLEGLSFPRSAKRHVLAVLLQSDLYHPRNTKRVTLTAKLLEENGIQTAIVSPDAKTKLAQTWQAIQFGSYTSLSLAQAHRIDPEPVPNVAAFKKALDA